TRLWTVTTPTSYRRSKRKKRSRTSSSLDSARISRISNRSGARPLASLRDIRRRIRGVKSIAQVTKAMQMVAATRMRRAQQRALDSRPYADAIREMVIELGRQRPDPLSLHPLQVVRPERTVAYMVFTWDRGLCGPLHAHG